MEKIGKIAVIGDGESATAFLAIGAAVYKVDDEYKAADVLRDLAKTDEHGKLCRKDVRAYGQAQTTALSGGARYPVLDGFKRVRLGGR